MKRVLLTIFFFLCLTTKLFAYQLIEEVATKAGGYAIPITVCVPEQAKGKMPVMFFVHGRGWNGGDEKHVPDVHIPSSCGYLCDPLGIIYVGLAYRCKGNKASFHDALNDLEASVAWFMQRTEKFNADLLRIGFSGASAGTTLSAVLAQRYHNCKAYIGSEGMYNILDQDENVSHFPSAEAKLDYGLVSHAQKREASPYHNLCRNPAMTVLFHGKDDWLCHYSQSEKYARKIREAGGTCKLILYEGINHTCFSISYPEVLKNSILETARLYIEAFELTQVNIGEIEAILDERTKLWYPYEAVPDEKIVGRWHSKRYGTLILEADGQGKQITHNGKQTTPLCYENRGSWFALSVNGDNRERHFYLRKNDHTIYELIVENNRYKNRRNDYRKQ